MTDPATDPLVPERELAFLLYDWLRVEDLAARPRYAGQGREDWDAVLASARRIALGAFLPHNRAADLNEPRVVDGRVEIIPEAGSAVAAFHDAGFAAAAFDRDHGGLQLPWSVTQACCALFQGANVATYAYPFLTVAAANLLAAFGTPDQTARWLPGLLAGRFFGTMCLSEPQAGSSLADIATRAEPRGDGTYRITGSKMWISGGEHELAETIVHLVLARIVGAPAGVKGISLFLVPRQRLDAAGSPAEPNDVTLVGLNHKLGYRGTVNTALSFGDAGDCLGELVGEENQGLACMFHMMNEARIGVGLSAAALAMTGYRLSLTYARERRQGRPAGVRDPSAAPVPILAHGDVRRMLLSQKAYAEGGLGLGLYCARLVDQQRAAADEGKEEESVRCRRLLDILTPVMKAWVSQYGLAANDFAIQVHGGYGYTRDFAVEQLWRDNRLNPIHEGTNGIQALDLLGRKLVVEGGAAWHLLAEEIRDTVDAAAEQLELADLAERLAAALTRVEATAEALLAQPAARRLAKAAVFMEAVGHLVIAWTWLSQATTALRDLGGEELAEDETGRNLRRGKLRACRFFFDWELPRLEAWTALLRRDDDPLLSVEDEEF